MAVRIGKKQDFFHYKEVVKSQSYKVWDGINSKTCYFDTIKSSFKKTLLHSHSETL